MSSENAGYRWRLPLIGRNPDESHRAATPLELFFDLVFVVAIAQAAAGLHHGIVENHILDAVINFNLVFFAIWWAWMSFTWFASMYDNGDVPYRLLVFLQLTGAVLLAAGVSRVFADRDLSLMLSGYIIMRVAMVIQSLRAARHNPSEKTAEHRSAATLILLQVLWTALVLLAPKSWIVAGALVLGTSELVTSAWANQKRTQRFWHQEHIAERYGLLTIIVLGETLLAASLAVDAIFEAGAFDTALLPMIAGGLLTVFAMWWIYFDEDASHLLDNARTAYLWGYGHYIIFGAAAAVGAGLAISFDVATHHGHISTTAAALSLAVPTSLFVLATWFLQERPSASNDGIHMPAAAVALLVTPWLPEPALLVGLIMTVTVAVKVILRHREGTAGPAAGSTET